jgi:large subunit ribosomal protein L52
MLRSSFIRQCQRAGQKILLAQGKGRCGNNLGPLHDLPDWEYADGTPAPLTRKEQQWKDDRRRFEEKVTRLAVAADQDALKYVDAEPSVRRHRVKDVWFYYDRVEKGRTAKKGEEDRYTRFKQEGKVPL